MLAGALGMGAILGPRYVDTDDFPKADDGRIIASPFSSRMEEPPQAALI
jgi:hypothetical protein